MDSNQYQKIIETLYSEHKTNEGGELADYIPELKKVDPNLFGIAITTVDGATFSVGDVQNLFSLQSISKPFVFATALQKFGIDKVRERVGAEPTGDVFHSTIKLDNSSRRPFNPFVNTGAIAMTDLIDGPDLENRFQFLKEKIEDYCGRSLEFDKSVYESEKSTGHRNRAIVHLMRHFGMVSEKLDESLDLYFRQCSITVNAIDLSMMAATLANSGVQPTTRKQVLSPSYVEKVLTLMFTCGLYNYAGEWAFEVGVPAKTGVCGGLLGVVPGLMGFSIFSPRLDEFGNSVRGISVGKGLSKELGLHTFGSYV